MEKRKVISILLGLIILITNIIMIIRIEKVVELYSQHQEEWSLSAAQAAQLTVIQYSVIICLCTIILVLINTLKTKKK